MAATKKQTYGCSSVDDRGALILRSWHIQSLDPHNIVIPFFGRGGFGSLEMHLLGTGGQAVWHTIGEFSLCVHLSWEPYRFFLFSQGTYIFTQIALWVPTNSLPQSPIATISQRFEVWCYTASNPARSDFLLKLNWSEMSGVWAYSLE